MKVKSALSKQKRKRANKKKTLTVPHAEEFKMRGFYRLEFIQRNRDKWDTLVELKNQYFNKDNEKWSAIVDEYGKYFPSSYFGYLYDSDPEMPAWGVGNLLSVEPIFHGFGLQDYDYLCDEGKQIFLDNAIEEGKTSGENTPHPHPFLAIDAVDKKENTVEIRVNLNNAKETIMRDVGFLIDLLQREGDYYDIKFERPKPHWGLYDKYLKVYDLRKEGKTWEEIAYKVYKGKSEKDLTKAREKVRKHYDIAKDLVNGGWRKL